jgi:glucoamylase
LDHPSKQHFVLYASKLFHVNVQVHLNFFSVQSYWNSDGLYLTSNTHGGRSGKDANSVLASIYSFDVTAGCDAGTFQPCSDKALANLRVYVDAFRSIYTLNKDIPHNAAVATGRYPEDVYYGGNVISQELFIFSAAVTHSSSQQPWYLTTSAVAEQLYDALIIWKAESCLTVTDISLAFFQQFSPSVAVGTYHSSSTMYVALVNAIRDYADGFLAINAKYTPADGSMAEQYGREDGAPLSAKHLTWSYASALSAFAARSGTSPASWGAKGLKVPNVCESNAMPMVKAIFHVVAVTVWGGMVVHL